MPASVHLECQNTGAIKMSVYVGYLKSMGNISVVIATIFMLSVEQFVVGVLDYYVSRWYVHLAMIICLSFIVHQP